jgi:riboflavin synthase
MNLDSLTRGGELESGRATAGKTMFTGLIQERGQVLGDPRPSGRGGVRLAIGLSGELAAGLGIGASLAVSGVCLTVVEIVEAESPATVPRENEPPPWRHGEPESAEPAPQQDGGPPSAGRPAPRAVVVELAPETLARTTLGRLRDGAAVNLEPALRAGDPLGGHLVQGHVDGTSEVVARRDLADHRLLAFALPPALAPYLVEKGSVTVDGVSLTVAGLAPDRFEVALLPHTLTVTTLGALAAGDAVNLEVDVLAKYVQRMLAARGLAPDPAAPAAAAAAPAPAPAGAGPVR